MKTYKDAVALRRALEARLKQQSEADGSDLGRLRRRVVFDRIATRLSVDPSDDWILKEALPSSSVSGTVLAPRRISTWRFAGFREKVRTSGKL